MEAVFLGLAGMLALLALVLWALPALLTALALASLSGLSMGRRHWLTQRWLARGHFPYTDLLIGQGYVTVITHNPRLARELAHRHPDVLRPPVWAKRAASTSSSA